MIDIVEKDCYGCTACASICPQNCISMGESGEGFLYPQVDTARCVSCGMCEKVCLVLEKQSHNDLKEAYAAITNDRDTLISSSSGGLFTELAKDVLSDGGCVFGAAFRNDFYSVHHIMIETEDDLSLLRGSKYVQSDMGDCYSHAKEQLQVGRSVLFSGTACQIAGFKSFLGKGYDNLLCVDIICHGTPSPLLWKIYLELIETQMGGKASAVSFRKKENGWRLFGMDMPISDGKHYYKTLQEDLFMQMFLRNLCLRESCYHCVVKESGTASDFTIGDFWGIERVEPDIENSMGVSLALIHTKKGKEFFERVSARMNTRMTNFDKAVASNSAYNHSVARPAGRETFFDDLRSVSWDKFVRKYTKDPLKTRIKRKLSASFIEKIRRKFRGTSQNPARGDKPAFKYGLMIEIE